MTHAPYYDPDRFYYFQVKAAATTTNDASVTGGVMTIDRLLVFKMSLVPVDIQVLDGTLQLF